MKNALTILICCLVGLTASAQGPSISLESYATGFFKPVDISNAGDDRLFITQQNGVIRIINGDGTVLPDPFLNIASIVNDNANERGLLGLAFHPDYANNGYFFVNYTGSGGDTYISRFSVSDLDPDVASPSSEEVLMVISQPYSNHNGGDLAFGPDGYLYIGMGDGGWFNDPQNNGQETDTYLGKMLRIDVDNQDPGLPYAVPETNPFTDPNDDILDEIWATGLRNPWRFSFDRLTGDLWIADVGQDAFEEINFQPFNSTGGENYGWRCYEASDPFITGNCGPSTDYVFPIAEYQHSGSNGCSVTGGYVYRGCAYPYMYGFYLFVDYCSGQFYATVPMNSTDWQTFTLTNLANLQYTSFGEDWNGELYIAAHGQGTIYRVTETTESFSVQSEVTPEACEGAENGSIEISWDDPNDPVSIEWEDGSTDETLSNLSAGNYGATVTTGNGCTVQLSIDVPVISPPLPEVEFVDGVLSVEDTYTSYTWYVDGMEVMGADMASYTPVASGEYTVVVVDENGCVLESISIMVIIESLKEMPNLGSFLSNPNPFSDRLVLQIDLQEASNLQIEITNAAGQVLYQNAISNTKSVQENIPTKSWPAGVYLVELQDGKGQITKRIVKE